MKIMTKEQLRDRFYVETGILEPFERLEEYMSWLEQKVIELSKLHQQPVIGSVCDCEPHTFYEWEKDENKCSQCGKSIYKQTDL